MTNLIYTCPKCKVVSLEHIHPESTSAKCSICGNVYSDDFVNGYWVATTEIKELINQHTTTKV